MSAELVPITGTNVTATPPPKTWNGDAEKLEAALRSKIQGEVRFDNGSRALYATDGSNYRQIPIGVVIPRDKQDVIDTVALCREFGAPILARGGGTSLAGQCCNVAVVLDFSKYMHHVLEINPEERWARVQPGCVLDDLRGQASQVGLTFGPDPATHTHCTLGGMIGNDSCGVHSVMAGRTADNVYELEILTYDGLHTTVAKYDDAELERLQHEIGRKGDIIRRLVQLRDKYAEQIRTKYPKIPRRVSGYNLDNLLPENGFDLAKALVGSECTCVVILEAKVRLVPNPKARSLLVLGYPDIYSAGDHVPEVMASKPIGCEAIDDRLIHYMRKKRLHLRDVTLLPDGKGFLLVEFGGDTKEDSDRQAHALMEELKKKSDAPNMKLYDDQVQEGKVWEIRESGLGATAFVPDEPVTWEGWEDAAVPPDKVGSYLRDFRKLLDQYNYGCALYGHFGQGCIHTRIDFDLMSAPGIAHYRSFVESAADLVVSYGGSLSGEHGDGQSRAELLPKMFGMDLIQAFREFKRTWDPEWKMNPGKVVNAYRVDENLRLGEHYRPWSPETHFAFPDDEGSFAKAALRCVGVGECRRENGKTMCPSYRVTREEADATRGRAHLLFEMMEGEEIRDGWKSNAVKESLDLCLACKGCKGDCPVNVDMATYKAEFLSHYYEGSIRPRTAYAFGLVDQWARLTSPIAGLANLVTQTPGLSAVAKWMAGMPQERRIPAFAPQTFKAWYRKRGPRNRGKQKVILWADTFNNYFLPHTAVAATEVLEAAGFQVVVPMQHLCCGRPLYDYGMLDTAKSYLHKVLNTLGEEIDAGTPIVGLEPSCVSVFRDEMTNLLPHDERAKRMHDQTFIFPEFLDKKAADWQMPKLNASAVVHVHCHQKALFRLESEAGVLKRLGLQYDLPNNGCCGLAGSFGFEEDKYKVSMEIANLELKPLLEKAKPETIVIADGFSCREQVTQASDREGLHVAEVIQMAVRGEQPGEFPERQVAKARRRKVRNSMLRAAAFVVGVGALAWWSVRKAA